MAAKIPPEITLQIFELATACSKPPEVRLEPKGGADGWDTYAHEIRAYCKDHRRSTQIKLSLNLVSRAWRHLATVLLYSDILISHMRAVARLADTLEASRHSLPNLVRSLDIRTSPNSLDAKERTEVFSFIHDLQSIVSYCPNLVRFTMKSRLLEGHSVHDVKSLVNALPSTLRVVEWEQPGLVYPDSGTEVLALTSLLTNSSNLESLMLRQVAEHVAICLPHLTTLSLDHCVLFDAFYLPNLRHLSLENTTCTTHNFWTTLGPQLHSLSLGGIFRWRDSVKPEYFLSLCINLRQFTYFRTTMVGPLPSHVTFPVLATIVLGTCPNLSFDFNDTEGHLWPLLGAGYPALECVRLRGAWDTTFRHWPVGWAQRLCRRGVRIENEVGVVVSLDDFTAEENVEDGGTI